MIITLCGSAKFEREFHIWNEALSLAGHVVYSLGVFPSTKGGLKDWYDEEEKTVLDLVHLKKIDASDAILVLNKGGYIGDSTKREIRWAIIAGKLIYSTEPLRLLGTDKQAISVGTLRVIPRLGWTPTIWTEEGATQVEPVDVFGDELRFMTAMEQICGKFDPGQVALYLKLKLEEICETFTAANPLNADLYKNTFGGLVMLLEANAKTAPERSFVNTATFDIVEFLDGLLDEMVVTINAGISADLPMREGWAEVVATNMAKLGPDGKPIRRADGKVLKPDGWSPPQERLKALIEHRMESRSQG